MSVDRARFFVDVELNRILSASMNRLGQFADNVSDDATIDEAVRYMTNELRSVADVLDLAIKDFWSVKLSDI